MLLVEVSTSGPDALRPSAPAKGHFQLQFPSTILHNNRVKRACSPCHRRIRHVLQCSKSRRGMSCDEAWLVICIGTGCGKRLNAPPLIHDTPVSNRENDAITRRKQGHLQARRAHTCLHRHNSHSCHFVRSRVTVACLQEVR